MLARRGTAGVTRGEKAEREGNGERGGRGEGAARRVSQSESGASSPSLSGARVQTPHLCGTHAAAARRLSPDSLRTFVEPTPLPLSAWRYAQYVKRLQGRTSTRNEPRGMKTALVSACPCAATSTSTPAIVFGARTRAKDTHAALDWRE